MSLRSEAFRLSTIPWLIPNSKTSSIPKITCDAGKTLRTPKCVVADEMPIWSDDGQRRKRARDSVNINNMNAMVKLVSYNWNDFDPKNGMNWSIWLLFIRPSAAHHHHQRWLLIQFRFWLVLTALDWASHSPYPIPPHAVLTSFSSASWYIHNNRLIIQRNNNSNISIYNIF